MGPHFRFWTASELVVLTGQRAWTVGELRELIATAPRACLFHHSFQVLRDRHVVAGRYPNDFVRWVATSVRDEPLAEVLAGIDLRWITAVRELREVLLRTLDEQLEARPDLAAKRGNEPFDLCRAQTVSMATPYEASEPRAFVRAVRRVGIRSVFFHLVTARLRLHMATNDFAEAMRAWGMPEAARRIEELDFYVSTLVELREQVASCVEQELGS